MAKERASSLDPKLESWGESYNKGKNAPSGVAGRAKKKRVDPRGAT